MKPAILLLKDGTSFLGRSFGAEGETIGEVVFNTSMTGYQEILTDPSYKGQLVTMTYPLIGNYGVHDGDSESKKIWADGLIVREYATYPNIKKGSRPLDQMLKAEGIVAIEQIDTRRLTRHLRDKGAMPGIISTIEFDEAILLERLAKAPRIGEQNMVSIVSCKKAYAWNPEGRHHVVAYDFGVKQNILQMLASGNCRVTVVPYDTSSEEILSLRPDGILLSNGPGDPDVMTDVVCNVQQLLGKKPIFGICLGHQILGLALGGKCYKLPFGHHGGNHPVMNLATQKIEITAQNHNYAIDPSSIGNDVEVTHRNLNDGTVEGIRHKKLLAFSLQYHPEGSPGPHDAHDFFDVFIGTMKGSV
ncbi:MAG: glutamine-hydrolyzing carbamoyl-phosphate synthase small subunit [Nitrospirota bacterium]